MASRCFELRSGNLGLRWSKKCMVAANRRLAVRNRRVLASGLPAKVFRGTLHCVRNQNVGVGDQKLGTRHTGRRMLRNLFGEIPALSAVVLLGLAALWLCSVLVGLWASRAQRRWPARIGIAASLVIFLAAWLYVSPLTRFLEDAIYSLCYPANRHYFASETAYAACAVILAASNVVGIVSVWASLGRPHWFCASWGSPRSRRCCSWSAPMSLASSSSCNRSLRSCRL